MPIRHLPMSRPVRGHLTPLAHQAVVHGETIYLAGMVADDKSLSVGGQTKQILEKLDALLKTLNSGASHLLFVMIYLANMKDKDELNAAWTAFFKPEDLPARAAVVVAQLGPQTLVEVVATAAAGAKVR
jgi:enamine deaminase RidA (YjgF/YER057c/UK114 family)